MKFGQYEMISLVIVVGLLIFGILLLFIPSDDVGVPVLTGAYNGILIFYFSKRTVNEKDPDAEKRKELRPFINKPWLVRGIIGLISFILLIPAYVIPSANVGIFLSNAIIVIEAALVSAVV